MGGEEGTPLLLLLWSVVAVAWAAEEEQAVGLWMSGGRNPAASE